MSLFSYPYNKVNQQLRLFLKKIPKETFCCRRCDVKVFIPYHQWLKLSQIKLYLLLF